MRTLNLTKKESDIPYEIVRFPDGEVMVRLGEIDRKEAVRVLCRITNAEELFILMQVGDILNRWGVEWHLEIFYLMSMRMDRVISFQEPFNLKIVTSVIKELRPTSVEVFHPHSSRSQALLSEGVLTKAWPFEIMHPNFKDFKDSSVQLCFPDKGAQERYQQMYSNPNPVLIGKKVRSTETGKILSIEIDNPGNYCSKPVMVVDDLCDAGGTFLGIAESIRKIDKDAVLNISVVHMVNRIGIDRLSKAYNEVFFTNSYRDWEDLPSNCHMFDVVKQ